MTFFVNLPNFPEWAIPMTKIIPKAYTDDAFMDSTISWNLSCRHLWQVTPNSNSSLPSQVTLRCDIEASGSIGSGESLQQVPVYIDIDLVFFNERTGKEVNTNKV
jgi:hypothetical protein